MTSRALRATAGSLRSRALVAIVLACSIAHAEDKPWAAGVPEDKQHDALALYREGNKLFEQDQFKDALPKYVAALALWDHPAIHYNAAVCLINLDRPVEAYEHLQAALRFGVAPLGDKLYKDALNYVKVLGGQIAPLAVSCAQRDAKVTLDGADLLACPASVEKNVLAKEDHQLVAAKPGYQTEMRSIRLEPGKKTTLVIELKPLAAQRKLVRRWSQWLPYAVIAVGGAVAAASTPAWLSARTLSDNENAWIDAHCMTPCTSQQLSMGVVGDLRSREQRDETIGIGVAAAGGAIVVAGVAMIVLNQPHYEHAIVPNVGSDHVGVTISGRW
jgi:hypothetical protein